MQQLEKYGIETQFLDNGMRIVLKRSKSSRVYAGLLVACGSLYEPDGKKGISHFLEHLVGEEGKTRNINSRLLYKISRDGGDVDQEVSEYFTAYELSAVGQFWYKDLKMFLDLVAELDFSEENFLNEQARIMAEIAESSTMDTMVRRRVFGRHPLASAVEGTKDSIAFISAHDIHYWHHKFYQPQRMALVVVGDVEIARVVRAVKSSKIYALENKEQINLPEEVDLNWEAKGELMGLNKNIARIVFPLPRLKNTYDSYLSFLLSNYLFDDGSIISLVRKVVFEMGIYEPPSTSPTITPCCSYFEMDIEAPSHKALARLERRFFAWRKLVIEHGLSRDIFRRIYLQREIDIKNLSDGGWFKLLKGAVTEGYFDRLYLYLEPEYVRKEELERVFREYFGGYCLIFRNLKNK